MINSLASRLKQARKNKNLTQTELALMADTSQDVIQKIENGKSLRPRNIDKIAKALDVSPAWLQFGHAELDALDKQSIEIAVKASELPPEHRKIILATIQALKG